MGAEQARELPIPGRELKGVHLAMEYLTQQNKRTAGIPISDEPITAKANGSSLLAGETPDPTVWEPRTVKAVWKCISSSYARAASDTCRVDAVAAVADAVADFSCP